MLIKGAGGLPGKEGSQNSSGTMSRGQAGKDRTGSGHLFHPRALPAGPHGPLPTSLSLLPTLLEPGATDFPLLTNPNCFPDKGLRVGEVEPAGAQGLAWWVGIISNL